MELKDYLTLIVSIATFSVSATTLYVKRFENRRAIRGQLTDAFAKLMQNNAEAQKSEASLREEGKTREFQRISGFYNDQRHFLVNQAVFLADQIPQHISDIEYSFIARALAEIGDQERSITYWRKCFRAARDDRSRALATRGLARYFFNIGNFEAGRDQYTLSLSLISGSSDNLKKTRGDTYLRWSEDELHVGFKKEAERHLDNAKVAIESIGAPRMKEHWLNVIVEAQSTMINTVG